jgi:hypothetical protein
MRWLLVTLALGACTGAEPDDVDTDTDIPLTIWPDPTVTASEPVDGASISGETMRVVVSTTNFVLTRKDEVVWSLPTPLSLLGGCTPLVVGGAMVGSALVAVTPATAQLDALVLRLATDAEVESVEVNARMTHFKPGLR